MPTVLPFRGLRYDPKHVGALSQVIAPPHDAIDAALQNALYERHPANAVRLEANRMEPGDDARTNGQSRAARFLRVWREQGVLMQEPAAAIYVCHQAFELEGRPLVRRGVLARVRLERFGTGNIHPHEVTSPGTRNDRLALLRACQANVSPVVGLYPDPEGDVQAILDAAVAGQPPIEAIDEHSGRTALWAVTDEGVAAKVAGLLGPQPVVIADGHHRYAISRTFRDEQRATDTGTKGSAELTMTYIGELIEEQLSVDAIHRLYTGIDADALLTALGDFFELSPAGTVEASITHEMRDRGALVFVHADGTGTYLTPKADRFAGVRDLDGARLEHALADVAHEVTYQHGVGLVRDIVSSGGAAAGVLIRPVTVREIQRTADEGLLMPPKSTFFTPKLRTGPVIRPLD